MSNCKKCLKCVKKHEPEIPKLLVSVVAGHRAGKIAVHRLRVLGGRATTLVHFGYVWMAGSCSLQLHG